MRAETIIRILTISALAGLLGVVGLKLTLAQVIRSLKGCRLVAILAANFIVVPALAVFAARAFGLSRETTIAMTLLAAAPFAPVVPVFANLARADLALAAGLTCVMPLLSSFLTPVVCAVALRAAPDVAEIRFGFFGVLLTLVATITLPLGLGVALHHYAPALGRRLLRPVEIAAEATGALSLAFVTATQFDAILKTGWRPLVAMGLVFEVALALGFWLGGPAKAARQVVALGTSNRNIALAVLVAIKSFAGTPVVSAVVVNGLVMIFLGLVHVGWWRLRLRTAAGG